MPRLALADDRLLPCGLCLGGWVGGWLQALKKFMMLGQGDFVTCLMDMIGQVGPARSPLAKPPQHLSRLHIFAVGWLSDDGVAL